MRSHGTGVVCALAWLIATPLCAAKPPAIVTIAATPHADPSAPIVLDGRLDEAAWAAAPEAELIQSAPVPGAATPYVTRFRFVAESERLFVAIVCRDPEAKRITGYARLRDGFMEGDDRVAIALDTFSDRRTGYLFQVNAVGTLADGLIAGGGSFSDDWDGIWNAAVVRDADGWTVEIELPSRSLQFAPGAASWGLNVTRLVPRDRVELLWASPTLDSAVIDMERAGTLTGVADLVQGLGLSVVPYVSVHYNDDRDSGRSSTVGNIGGEIYYNVTPQLQGVLTANTDFAETEVDELQTNLTRFPLFFPEKRGFFLEGSNLFDFGLGLEEDFLPFYSRRIGLYEGAEVPIDAGVKLQGRAGRFGVALLDTRTGAGVGDGKTNLFASRLSWESDSGLRLGAIATDGHPDSVTRSTLFGVDAVYRSAKFLGDKNFELAGWAAGSTTDPQPQGQTTGYGFKVAYPNDLWDLSASFSEFGDALDPALGFLPRPGTRQYAAGGAWQPRPTGRFNRWVRQFFFELFPNLVTDLDNRTESWRLFAAPLNVELQSGDSVEANWVPQHERLTEAFEIAPGVIIPAGGYDFTRYRLEAETSEHRAFAGGFTWWFGDFYGGRLDEFETYLGWGDRLGWVSLIADWQRFLGDLPGGAFDFTLSSLRCDLAFSKATTLSALAQYDSSAESLGMHVRFRWTPRPGTDLFLVWNRGYRALPEETLHDLGDLLVRQDNLTTKLRWTFRR